jgi:hypothetical protein
MGTEREEGLKVSRKNFERQHINGALGTEIGEGSYGNIVKELGGYKRPVKRLRKL